MRRVPFALTLTWALVAIYVGLSLSFVFAGDEPGLILTGILALAAGILILIGR